MTAMADPAPLQNVSADLRNGETTVLLDKMIETCAVARRADCGELNNTSYAYVRAVGTDEAPSYPLGAS